MTASFCESNVIRVHVVRNHAQSWHELSGQQIIKKLLKTIAQSIKNTNPLCNNELARFDCFIKIVSGRRLPLNQSIGGSRRPIWPWLLPSSNWQPQGHSRHVTPSHIYVVQHVKRMSNIWTCTAEPFLFPLYPNFIPDQ